MTTRPDDRRAFLQLVLAACALLLRGLARQDRPPVGNGVSLDARTSTYHVHPQGRIQDALEAAARDPVNETIYVHAGTYRPAARGQALIWFNARHDGITLEAVGDVTLTASNPEMADSRAPSYPPVVNHVVYFGDGVSRQTVLRGFKITGAKNFTTGSGDKSPIESDDLRKTAFFYTDGRGIKIYARSYPTIEHVDVFENYASPCGGGGVSAGSRYELDITDAAGVRGSFIHSAINDLRGRVNRQTNTFDPPDPRFDAQFSPQAPEYAGVGYRPVKSPSAERSKHP
jgi:hypothetical protein